MGLEVAGSRVLVTGASSGIGAATAVLLAERGATVGLVARRADRLDAVLERCRAHAPASRRWAVDLADLDAVTRLADEAWDAFGGLDVLVNNAGIPKRRPAPRLTIAEVSETLHTNLLSPVQLTLALLDRFLAARRGVIVNVGSLAGRVGVPTEAAYCASKFGLSGWSEALAIDLAGTGVEVRLVVPGAIATEIWDQPGNDPPVYVGPLEPPETVAEAIAAAIEGDEFETYVPDLKAIVELKTSDPDAYLEGAAAFREQPDHAHLAEDLAELDAARTDRP
ncbi:MAG TPA: SDR family oxidoreductase [Acidimicrobiales bacterium]